MIYPLNGASFNGSQYPMVVDWPSELVDNRGQLPSIANNGGVNNYGSLPNPRTNDGSTGISALYIRSNTPGEFTISASIPGLAGQDCTKTIHVIAPDPSQKPYLKTFGGEVMAGGSIGGSIGGSSCTPPSGRGGIYTWAEERGGNYVGSSAQLTISSLLSVNQFYSASQRSGTSNSLPPKGLTIANTGPSGSTPASTYGGGSGNALCITDYYNDTRDSNLPTHSWSSALPANAGRVQYTSSGDLTIGSNLNIPTGTQAAVYVDGNVFINSQITYATGASTWNDHPYFVIVARGNIYIGPDATRLDGLYVSQPDSSNNRGTIYTCALGLNQTYGASSVYDNCQNQLTINGGLVARDIRFLRFHGSLEEAVQNELPNFASGQGTKAAEVINYTPEMFLAPSPLKRPNSSPSDSTSNPRAIGKYDSIRSLPPVY